jgi:DNA modification methylase/ParB-like chromosome segregation protein Spo0J
MQTIVYDKVVVPENRQRKEFDETAMIELVQSILKPIGLMQPIVLRDDGVTLVAGERRLRAFRDIYESHLREVSERKMAPADGLIFHNGTLLPLGQIPYVRLSDLPIELIREAELEENVRRIDLTWQEKVAAQAQLHEHLLSQNPEQTITATAQKIYGDGANKRKVNEVSEAINLSKYLDDPIVATAPDEKTARRAIKDELARQERRERLASIDLQVSSHRLFLGDSFVTAVSDSADVRFDCIVTDPPYGIDADAAGQTFDSDAHEYDDSEAAFQRVCEHLPQLCFSLCREKAHVYVFCDIRRFTELFVAFELGGFTVWRKPLIWDKGTVGSYGNIEYGPRACYDAILFARKGDKPALGGARDVININQRTDHEHPAGKPIELYSELLKRSVLPGDKVADFFAGSGPIFPAAKAHACTAYGWEMNQKYFEMAQASLATTL